jgi:chitodextrinase
MVNASQFPRQSAARPGHELDGDERPEPSLAAPVWTPSRVFDSGDLVVHDGVVYEARWWNRHQEPGSASGPWEVADRA